MKKILLLCFTIILLTGCRSSSKLIKSIEIDNSSCQIVREIESHGGFLGDGEYFARITCSKISVSDLSSNWKELPITDSISEILEMIKCDNSRCTDTFTRYEIPNDINGYYYFYDRHDLATDRYDSTDINTRSSYNFNLAVLDIDNKVIYYYELDT